MKRIVVGILAHVDSGKTTLSEALLFNAGNIKKLGRVDHKDAFLDTDTIEKDRGITIFSKQAVLKIGDTEITLLDTPGHVDFSAETERTLRVLDYAILVISAQEGVQSHTKTLWTLLKHYDIPTFIFINKMDLVSADKEKTLLELKDKLDTGCIDFTTRDVAFFENIATTSNELLDEYLSTEKITDDSTKKAIASRKVFPCFCGSALKTDGVGEFLSSFDYFTLEKNYGTEFGAKVYKIAEDDRGQRLSFMKITSGSLKIKTTLSSKKWSSKINELRIYSGIKYKTEQEVFAGSICAVPGLLNTYPGEGLGCEPQSDELLLEPVFTYSVALAPDADILSALAIFKKLEQEETQMHVIWNEYLSKIDVQVMGEVQLEVLKRILEERFGLLVDFTHGSIIYKETIRDSVIGVGHFEPLRHYAEVHLLIEEGERGSGLVFSSDCSEEVLEKNWQRLIMSHLSEKEHKGVLLGAPITDLKITLINGKASRRHTEGGDFRQATYRALRQGLMQADSLLLEPYYSFTLEIPTEHTGRAMTDLERLGAEFSAPITKTDVTYISGKAPISRIMNYHLDVISYTHGMGKLNCIFDGYAPCLNQDEIVKEKKYNPEMDTENTPHSVFCSHGSGFTVKWDEVFDYMHLPLLTEKKEDADMPLKTERNKKLIADEEELLRIFEQTYGKIQRNLPRPMQTPKNVAPKYKGKAVPIGPEYLLIDGYNIIFASNELKEIAKTNLEDARNLLINRVCNYRAIRQNNIILVFDAYKVKGNGREIEEFGGIKIVYTKEAETADSYIEKTTHKLCKNYKVKVATSDNLEQIIIFGHGAIRISASEFLSEVLTAEEEMRKIIEESNRKNEFEGVKIND